MFHISKIEDAVDEFTALQEDMRERPKIEGLCWPCVILAGMAGWLAIFGVVFVINALWRLLLH